MTSTAKVVDAGAPPQSPPESHLKKEGVFSGVRSRFHGFVNASLDDHKACITSSYNKAKDKIKCITTRSWIGKGDDQETAAGGSPASVSATVESK